MSIKELCKAHALIKNDEMDKKSDTYRSLVDDAIGEYIEAERYLRIHLQGAVQRAHGVEDVAKDDPRMNQIYRERFKTVICKRVVQRRPIPEEWSENEAMQYLADYHGCPNAFKNWQ